MKLFLGVDGGQSGTTALIGDQTGRILGEGEAGPCNHAQAGEGRAKLERAVGASLRQACEAASLNCDTVHFAAACFGMSGGPDDKQDILAAILRTDRLLVTTDAVTALAGATAEGQGIITIAGTGSIAFGRNAEGVTARAGGWGYIFGDEGGAFDLVRQALRAALRMEEGWGPPTALRAVLLEATESVSANVLLHRFYTDQWPRSRVATLARLVDDAAVNGDGVALEIVNRAAIELALLAASVRGQLWKSGDPVSVAYIGGVFESQTLRQRFRMLVELEDGNRCGPPLHGPAEGALLEAYRSSGVRVELKR
ncbi:MAG TPA: BadF/BadG/BcrA/BcrD ATPase family protein [Candidatus Sulfopaludibacter sp.]|jgi:N-acetylglucosamine kinase|nr:BadF/BadG/BcrA/BcrD ATPase family protein [Candidatus Sulfopaludibacter sp.]